MGLVFPDAPPCWLESVGKDQTLVGAYVPQCTASGHYEHEQCDGSTGYCWCVTEFGEEIPGTRGRSWEVGDIDCDRAGKLFVLITAVLLLVMYRH